MPTRHDDILPGDAVVCLRVDAHRIWTVYDIKCVGTLAMCNHVDTRGRYGTRHRMQRAEFRVSDLVKIERKTA